MSGKKKICKFLHLYWLWVLHIDFENSNFMNAYTTEYSTVIFNVLREFWGIENLAFEDYYDAETSASIHFSCI